MSPCVGTHSTACCAGALYVLLSLMAAGGAIFCGSTGIILSENFVEMIRGFVADQIADIEQTVAGICKIFCSLLHAEGGEVIQKIAAGLLFEKAAQIGGVHSNIRRDGLERDRKSVV